MCISLKQLQNSLKAFVEKLHNKIKKYSEEAFKKVIQKKVGWGFKKFNN